jgi:serine/threonine protein phosphatase PrpC
MYTAFSYTMAGRKRNLTARRTNEDRVLIREFPQDQGGPAILAAVADGVSRCADGGAVAQWLIHDRLAADDLLAKQEETLARTVEAYLRRVHDEFIGQFDGNEEMMESATTLAGVLVLGRRACVFTSGDSPVHLLRRDKDRLFGETLTEPDKIPGTPMLTDCFSGVTAFDFRVREVELHPGDFLICATDGLVLGAEGLAESLSGTPFSKQWAEHICTESYNFPGSDDVGVAAIRFD